MKKKIIGILIILIILTVTFSGSVAIFSWLQEGNTENSIKIGDLTFKYTEMSKIGNGINLNETYPMSEEDGKVLEEYFDFKVEGNLSRSDLEYEVEIDTTLADIPDSGIKVYLTEVVNGEEKEINSVVNLLSSYETSKDGRIIYRETILKNTKNYEKNFRLRLWVDEAIDWTDDEYLGHSGIYKVNVRASSNQSMAASDVVTDRTATIERVVANNKYLFVESNDENVDYEVTVPYTVNNVDIEVYESNTQATSEITPLSNLSGVSTKTTSQNIHTGNNYFKTVVTSSNERNQEEYILKVVKEADPRNDLLNLEVEGYALTPTFDPNTTEYTLTLEEPSITISGNKVSDVASISGLGEKTLTFGENEFTIGVTSESGEAKNYTITVTNSRPTAPTITGGTGSSWVSTNQTISLAENNQAFAISGIDHYEVYDTNTSVAPLDNTEATTTTSSSYLVSENGIHYIYYRTVSNKGFKSVWSSGQVVMLDKSAPTDVTITASDSKSSDTWHTTNYTLTVSATKNGTSNLTYYFGTSSNPSTEGNSTSVSTETNGTTYYAKVCNEFGLCTEDVRYIAKLDKTKPDCSWSGESTAWTSSNRTITATCNKGSGSDCTLVNKQWLYSTGTTQTANLSIEFTDQAGNSYTCSKTANVYVDKVAPTLTLSKITYKSDNFSGWGLNNATVSNGVLTLGANGNAAVASSGYYDVNNEAHYYTFDAYTYYSSADFSPKGGILINNSYYDANKNVTNETTSGHNYQGNGWARNLTLNTWESKEFEYGKSIYGYKYEIVRFSSSPKSTSTGVYSISPVLIKNFKIWGQLVNSFYYIDIAASDNLQVSQIKYASGSQTKDYFKTSGTVTTSNRITVTQNGTYTVYVKDVAGNEVIKTIQINRIG